MYRTISAIVGCSPGAGDGIGIRAVTGCLDLIEGHIHHGIAIVTRGDRRRCRRHGIAFHRFIARHGLIPGRESRIDDRDGLYMRGGVATVILGCPGAHQRITVRTCSSILHFIEGDCDHLITVVTS